MNESRIEGKKKSRAERTSEGRTGQTEEKQRRSKIGVETCVSESACGSQTVDQKRGSIIRTNP